MGKESTQCTSPRAVNALATDETQDMSVKKEKVVNLQQQLQDAEVDAASSEAAATMHTVTPGKETCAQ